MDFVSLGAPYLVQLEAGARSCSQQSVLLPTDALFKRNHIPGCKLAFLMGP